MTQISPLVEQHETDTRSWVIFLASRDDLLELQREVDIIFKDYSFYPEIDWGKYGYRPPEGYQILGGWRQPKSMVFVFLLDNPHMITANTGLQAILHLAGDVKSIDELESKFECLKSKFKLKDKKAALNLEAEKSLDRIYSSRSHKILLSVIGSMTAIINAFSLYLRQLPAPQLSNKTIQDIYSILLGIIHFSALLLLLMFIFLFAIFIYKFSLVLIKKM